MQEITLIDSKKRYFAKTISRDHEYRMDLVLILGLLLLALITRGYGLSDWSFVHDEYFTLNHAYERMHSLVNPAGYALVALMFKFFGVSEWSARFPSFILGSLSIPLTYLIWRSLLGRNTALLAALIIALSSWHLWYSQFARYYAGVFLFGMLSYYLYYQAIRRSERVFLLGAIATNITAVLFHATAVMVPVSCAVFSIILLSWKGTGAADYSKKMAGIYLTFYCIAGIAALPALLRILDGWVDSGQHWGYGPAGLLLQIIKYVQIPIAVGAFFGLLRLMQKDFFKGLFFAVGIGVPLIAVLSASAVVSIRPDYMFYAFPLIILLAAYLCEELRIALADLKIVSYACIALVLIGLVPEMVSYYTGKKSLDFRQAIKYIEESYRPGDRILSFVNGFGYYASRDYPLEPYLGNEHDNAVAWPEVLEKYNGSRQRLWIILLASRKPLARDLESWLFNNTSLVWHRYEERYDFSVKGYQVFLKRGEGSGISPGIISG